MIHLLHNQTLKEDKMREELTDAQVEQCDYINSIAYKAMIDLLGHELEWDIEWIGELSDCMASIAERYFDVPEMETYPYIEYDEEDEDA
jgi:hypothetical protein